MKTDKIFSTQPVKGTSDWLPEELKIRHYIFSVWRGICERYGFEEYLTPMLENAEIYRAKSGEDVGQKELMIFVDQGGRELALRPEMTPSVTRLISKVYATRPKPIRFFSIANFIRNEKPQRGRNREFWQLNCDIFGSTAPAADWEILRLALDIMLAFNPPEGSFILGLNDRRLLDGLLDLADLKESELRIKVIRILDKYSKLKKPDFIEMMQKAGAPDGAIDICLKFMSSSSVVELLDRLPALKDNIGLKAINDAIEALKLTRHDSYVKFRPDVIRGFDYYDGLVFEIFDCHPDNQRALFGGGRYNGLAGLFGAQSFPAIGFAPGDETTKLFLESWGLLDRLKTALNETAFLPLLDKDMETQTQILAHKLRQAGVNLEAGLEPLKVGKALEYANKRGFAKMIIFGADEQARGIYKVKNLLTGVEEESSLNNLSLKK
jgi:histidyl-tRNA synthetase